jgi:hypothetical protein
METSKAPKNSEREHVFLVFVVTLAHVSQICVHIVVREGSRSGGSFEKKSRRILEIGAG